MKNDLINYNPIFFCKDEKFNVHEDVRKWLAVYKVIGKSVALNDRTNNIKLPIKTFVPDQFKLPVYENQSLLYKDCIELRIKELLKIHEVTGKKLVLMYSGGIDSSAILAGFVHYLGVDHASKILDLLLSQESIIENPHMWEKIIRPNFTIHNSKIISLKDFKQNNYLILGELNDQLFGSDVLRNIIVWGGNTILEKKCDVELGKKFLTEYCKMDERSSELWISLLIKNLTSCPNHNQTFHDVFWWYNFTLKWINVCYRLVMYADTEVFDPSILSQNYCNFYDTKYFQLWSMNNKEDKHKGTWNTYKWAAKNFVVESTDNKAFIDKTKRNSLPNVLSLQNSINFVYSDFSSSNSIDNSYSLYNSENSFHYE